MKTRSVNPRNTPGVRRRELLHARLATGAALAAWPLSRPSALWGGTVGPPKHGGTLRVRGWDPPHFDPHLTINNYTNYLLSFTHSRLVRHTVGADVQPGTFTVEPDVAEHWEALDDTTYVFHYDIQRYAAEQQYFVYLNVNVITASWAPYVKNYGANITFDYGNRAAALWLER